MIIITAGKSGFTDKPKKGIIGICWSVIYMLAIFRYDESEKRWRLKVGEIREQRRK